MSSRKRNPVATTGVYPHLFPVEPKLHSLVDIIIIVAVFFGSAALLTDSAQGYPIHPQNACKPNYWVLYSSSSSRNPQQIASSETTTTGPTATRDENWTRMVTKLRKFHQIHGHSIVKKENDPVLHRWMSNIRKNYKADPDLLFKNKEKLQMLEELDFPWDLQQATWHWRYQQLCDFANTHGHCRVPADVPRLGIWVRNQRREYLRLERGEPSTMTTERLQLLERVGFEWYRSRKEAWESRYMELKEFWKQQGHTDVPQDYADNFSLGQWCMNQRIAYKRYLKNEATALTPERIKLLEKIDFRWSPREHRWHSMHERLRSFYKMNGHTNIPPGDAPNADLRIWLTLQRYHYNRREEGFDTPLSDQRIKVIEDSIPSFRWKVRVGDGPSTDDWAKLFDAMREKGIQPGMPAKQHWFDGMSRFDMEIKHTWTDEELLALWNAENEDEDD